MNDISVSMEIHNHGPRTDKIIPGEVKGQWPQYKCVVYIQKKTLFRIIVCGKGSFTGDSSVFWCQKGLIANLLLLSNGVLSIVLPNMMASQLVPLVSPRPYLYLITPQLHTLTQSPFWAFWLISLQLLWENQHVILQNLSVLSVCSTALSDMRVLIYLQHYLIDREIGFSRQQTDIQLMLPLLDFFNFISLVQVTPFKH